MRLRGGGLIGAVTTPMPGPTPAPGAAPGVWSMDDVLAAQQAGTWPTEDYAVTNAEAAALIARFTTPPSSYRKELIDNLVGSLKAAGVWARLDGFWMLAAHAAQPARQNWIRDDHNLTAISSPAFTADRGYKGDGGASYLSISNQSGQARFLLNDAELGVWSRIAPTNGQALLGTGNRTRVHPISTGSTFAAQINSGSAVSYSQPDTAGLGLFSAATDNPTTMTSHKNTVQVGTNSRTLQLNEAPSSLLRAPSTSFSDGQASMGYSGGALTSQQRAALYSATLTYLQAVGAV